MSKESGLIPLEQLNDVRVNFSGLKLPPYLSGKLAIDVAKTHRLMNIGGIFRVNVVSKDEDQAVPQVLGFDAQGNAYAGAGKTRNQPLEKKSEDHLVIGGLLPVTWRDIEVEISPQELAERLAARSLLSSPDAWGKALNERINGAIRDEGRLHSLKPSRAVAPYVLDATLLNMLRLNIQSNLNGDYNLTAISSAALAFPAFLKLYKLAIDPVGCYDILDSIHPVRAFWTEFRARTAYRNLISAMPPKTE